MLTLDFGNNRHVPTMKADTFSSIAATRGKLTEYHHHDHHYKLCSLRHRDQVYFIFIIISVFAELRYLVRKMQRLMAMRIAPYAVTVFSEAQTQPQINWLPYYMYVFCIHVRVNVLSFSCKLICSLHKCESRKSSLMIPCMQVRSTNEFASTMNS